MGHFLYMLIFCSYLKNDNNKPNFFNEFNKNIRLILRLSYFELGHFLIIMFDSFLPFIKNEKKNRT